MSDAEQRLEPRSPIEALKAAIEIAKGQSAFARLLSQRIPAPDEKVKQGHVSNWLRAGRLPEKYAVIAEEALGGQVKRYEFAPTLYRRKRPAGAATSSAS